SARLCACDGSRGPRDLHPFPTRRSSDLTAPPGTRPRRAAAVPARDPPAAPVPRPGTAPSRPAPPPLRTAGPEDAPRLPRRRRPRSEEHTSELQSRENLVCRLLLEKKNED